MEWKEFSGKTVDDALMKAMEEFNTPSDKLEYEVIERESTKLLGLINKPAVIRVSVKMSFDEIVKDFLSKVFDAMDMVVQVDTVFDEEERTLSVELSGDEMGILIGKRGITLDSLQYLISLVVNRNSENYIKVKLDTENYRKRRKETLENLARNLAQKVKRIHKPVYLEPMNPYERRVIHSTLQKDRYVETHSEGEEPYRKVVINLKPGMDNGYEHRGRYSKGKSSYGRGGYRKSYRGNNHRKNYNYDKEEALEENAGSEFTAENEVGADTNIS